MPLLAVENLTVTIARARVVDGVNLTLAAGSTLALVGESGAGKTMTALSIMRLLPVGASASGRVLLDGVDLAAASEAEMCDRRGRTMAMVFQEPATALNPLKTIGAQVAETVLTHHRIPRRDAERMAAEALDRVGLPQSRVPHDRFPHEISGGERQRVLVAIATVLQPRLVIADEPVSAVDVASQAIVLDLLRRLVIENGSALLMISHDLAAVASIADSLAIMRRGTVVESGPAPGIFRTLRHPYSHALLSAATYEPARRPAPPRAADGAPLLKVEDVVRDYAPEGAHIAGRRRAVDGVSLTIAAGETVALVGESGSGKSTLARVILALDRPLAGRVFLDGADFLAARGSRLRTLRRRMQAVFQDPYGSFDPRRRVWRSIAEPLALEEHPVAGTARRKRVDEMLSAVGLASADGDKYPHEFSGGERQRLALARALITRPALVILDEPVSALDVSIRAQVLDLLVEIRERFALAYLFISHDLGVVRAIAHRVLVMREGKIVEEGPTDAVFGRPQHPYARALVGAVPDLAAILARREAAAL